MDEQKHDPIHVVIELTYKDYCMSQYASLGRNIWFILGFGILFILGGVYTAWVLKIVWGWIAIAFGAILAGIVGIQPILFRRSFKANKKFTIPQRIEASVEGLRIAGEHSKAEVKWSAFMQFVETKGVFLLYTQPRLFLMFPKRFFLPEQMREFELFVHANIQPKGRKDEISFFKTILIWAITAIAAGLLWSVIQKR